MTFTASNGLKMWLNEGGDLVNDDHPGGMSGCVINSLWVEAVREFFERENDERLGRWRWPENPDYVVYPMARDVQVVCERDTFSMPLTRAEVEAKPDASNPAWLAARAYFAAHPEPKPWHDAIPGQVWVVTEHGQPERAYLVDDTQFYDSARDYALNFDDSTITAARRIWPEEEN